MATPMRSLTDQSGLKFSSLATTVAWRRRDAAELDERRVADGLGDVVVNFGADGCGIEGHGNPPGNEIVSNPMNLSNNVGGRLLGSKMSPDRL